MEEDTQKVPPASDETKPEVKTEGEQDLLKNELDRVKTKRTPVEKLIFKKNEIDRQLRELNAVESSIEDDDQPMTRREFKEIQASTVIKNALQLADEIENESERELVKYYLQNKIRSSGNPREDVSDARALANKVKNAKIAELAGQKPGVIRTSSQGGATPYIAPEEELSPAEQRMMKAPWNLTKDAILKARKQTNKSAGVETRGDDTQV